MNNTICNIATSNTDSSISIIRVSGDECLSIVNKIFTRDIMKLKSHTINYGHIHNNGEIVDEVLLSIMKGPRSYTKEDIIEINCHGGRLVTMKILELLLQNGCKLSEPGEFTKRAFLNGRIDLTQASAVMDIISAKTDLSLKLAQNTLRGKISSNILGLIEQTLEILGAIEVNIDYPEYDDVEEMTNEVVKPKLDKLLSNIDYSLLDSKKGELIKNGIDTIIIGSPNAGKSSLFNLLSKDNKAIVTDIAGTTRDSIEAEIILNDIKLNLIDTAGLRDTEDVVEKIGVDRTYKLLKESTLVLHIIDGSKPLTKEDNELLSLYKEKEVIHIINKSDLGNSKINIKNSILISVKENKNIDVLENEILKRFNLNDISQLNYLSHLEDISKLKQAKEAIKLSVDCINNNEPIDMVNIHITECYNLLNEIIGNDSSTTLLDDLFSKFCLGK